MITNEALIPTLLVNPVEAKSVHGNWYSQGISF
jgi:hypothetical protein